MLSFAGRRSAGMLLRSLATSQPAMAAAAGSYSRGFATTGLGRGDSIIDVCRLQEARTWDDGVADGFKATTGEHLFKVLSIQPSNPRRAFKFSG
eukprot:scaffold452406_cov36-Prasinocladus_malaysianus.AAC.1